jgi:hypothetical protein
MGESRQAARRAGYAKMVAKAWTDPAFKSNLLTDPKAALAAAGISVPAGVALKVVENTDKVIHLVLPARPNSELSDEALDKVAGGDGWSSFTMCCCLGDIEP